MRGWGNNRMKELIVDPKTGAVIAPQAPSFESRWAVDQYKALVQEFPEHKIMLVWQNRALEPGEEDSLHPCVGCYGRPQSRTHVHLIIRIHKHTGIFEVWTGLRWVAKGEDGSYERLKYDEIMDEDYDRYTDVMRMD